MVFIVWGSEGLFTRKQWETMIKIRRTDSGSYMDVFEQDIVESEKKIIVSSPEITKDKVE